MTLSLYDNNSKLLDNRKITGNETMIDMSQNAPSVYFLKITSGNREIKSFKIIKK
jgi:hypothetical protein